ncbi:hypothetical protein FRC08_013715 [Ceratobasidium sp. 394]|nr:hypothetical protein FRC08_013715 [Ceratobasidium sp. 394]
MRPAWVDSDYPVGTDLSKLDIIRGMRPTTSGKPSGVKTDYANSFVTFSNIRFGDIGSTFSGSTTPGIAAAQLRLLPHRLPEALCQPIPS